MKLEFYRQILQKYSNIKFHKNPSSGSRVVPCGQTNRRTGMTTIIVVVRYLRLKDNEKLNPSPMKFPWLR